MTPAHRRLVAPLLFIVVGVWLLTGCVYIPTFGRRVSGIDATRYVGPAHSSKQLCMDRATRDDVLRVLGRPYYISSDERAVVYWWRIQNGLTVWPLCFGGYPVYGERTLVLRFNTDGRLESTQLLKSNANVIQLSGYGGGARLPPDLRRDAYLRSKSPASAPATQPATEPTNSLR